MTGDERVQSVQQIVAGILDVPADEVNCDIPVQQLDGWDNILHMTLIFRLQDEIGQRLTHEQVVECTSIRDFASLMDRCLQSGRDFRH